MTELSFSIAFLRYKNCYNRVDSVCLCLPSPLDSRVWRLPGSSTVQREGGPLGAGWT